MTLPDSKVIMYTLCGASLACAILLTGLYGLQGLPRSNAPLPSATIFSLGETTLSAKAAIVYDPTTKKILFAYNAENPLPLASLTKLMAAEAVLAVTPEDTLVTITAQDLKPEGDWGFSPGETWTLHDLLTFGLVASSNDALAAAAAAAPGNTLSNMNLRAAELGLTRTYFNNPTGLDVDLETAGAYGSAHDMALLAASFLARYPGLFEATASPTLTIHSGAHTLVATSTALPLHEIPGLIGAKTGYTDLAGGNLIAAFDIEIGHPVIVVVLGSTRDGRFDDVKKLIHIARQNALGVQ